MQTALAATHTRQVKFAGRVFDVRSSHKSHLSEFSSALPADLLLQPLATLAPVRSAGVIGQDRTAAVGSRKGAGEQHAMCSRIVVISPNARSRLDRLFCNWEHTHCLHYSMSCAVLQWCPELSRDRAVSFRRLLPSRDTESLQPLADHIVDHPDWPSKVVLT